MGLGTYFGLTNPLVLSSFMSRVVPGLGNAAEETGQEIVELATKEVHMRLYPGHGYRTGALYDSYNGRVTKEGTEHVMVEFGSDLYYAPYTEFRWGGRVSHFFPAMAEVERRIPELFSNKINGVLGIR